MPKLRLHNFSRSALLAVPLFGTALGAAAQALPTAPVASTGFVMPELNGQLSYAITASETLTFGAYGSGGNLASTNISGDVAYLSRSEYHPFSMVYSGGYIGYTNRFGGNGANTPYPSGTFQNLALSQVMKYRRNTFILADTVSYLPQSPIAGLSGVPGVGDLGVNAIQPTSFTGPGILTQYQKRVTNLVSGSEIYDLTGKTSIHGTGSYAIQRFLGDGPLGGNNLGNYASYDSNQVGGSAGVTHQVDRRNSFSVDYSFNRFEYKDQPYSFTSHSILGEYSHRFSPDLVLTLGAGPQINNSSTFTNRAVTTSALANLTYYKQRTSYALSFTRGTNNGSGVVQGAVASNLGFAAQHTFSRTTSGAFTVGYTHSSSISSLVFTPFSVDSVVTGAQVNRSLGRAFSVFASYTLQKQVTSNAAFNTLAFNGLTQYVGFGVTYSPSSLRMGRH